MKQTIITALIILWSACLFGQKDSTKPIQQPTDTLYQLTMTAQELNVVLLSIFSPDDISPNQRKALDAWLRKEIRVIPPKPKQK